MDIAFPLLAAALLVAGAWWVYNRWAAPYLVDAPVAAKALMGVVVVAIMVAIGVPFWWFDADQSFSWNLPPLASRMLAMAGLSFVTLGVLVLGHPSHRRVRLLLVMLEVYLAPLAVAIAAFHLDRFDFGKPITYGFLIIAFGITIVATYFLLRQPEIMPDDERDSLPSTGAGRAVLGLIAAVTFVWGLALVATDAGPNELVWVWPGDLLTSRLIGVMLLAIAAGSIYSLPRADTTRVMAITSLVYGVGLAAASAWNVAVGKPMKPAYVVVFGVVAVLCAALIVLDRTARTAGEQADST